MRLKITKEHVEAAESEARVSEEGADRLPSPGAICPAAQALLGLGYAQVYVGPRVAVCKKGEWRGRFLLPPALQAQIESWDHGFGFEPIEVELTPAN
jgi:hypothetical protein